MACAITKCKGEYVKYVKIALRFDDIELREQMVSLCESCLKKVSDTGCTGFSLRQ